VDAIITRSVNTLAAELAVAARAALADALVMLEAEIALGSVRGDGNPLVIDIDSAIACIET
jgi:hypothetical protein